MSAEIQSSHDSHNLIRITRALINCINVASVATDEQQLFQSICDILVNTGLFRLAWFGYADAKARRIGGPIASSGDEDAHLQDLSLILPQADYEDTANVSLRTGAACWIKDLRVHPALTPSQAATLERRHYSVLSFPVLSNGQAYGAFTLLGDEPERLGPATADILKERIGHARTVFHSDPGRRARAGGYEAELRELVDLLPQPIVLLGADGVILYCNRADLEYHGYPVEDLTSGAAVPKIVHPDDLDGIVHEAYAGFSKGVPFEYELRLRRKDGQYRWFLFQQTPLRDEQRRIVRWLSMGTDIEDRKQAEERLRKENLALREEIDRSSLFDEIVGSSEALRRVQVQVAKVAPGDTTVLILGETGTGKELMARAVHRRSKRANQAFIPVNCAAIPPSLIASELFGHEKGAFTGALERRIGRFESADKGTIFLDEIGDLPVETQTILLRVLQEREFERVGGAKPIRVDVRVVTATNRDLEAAVNAGNFREDLYYRLNVFPVRVPSLRERADDIPLLVEYFIARYAQRAGKRIEHIDKNTLDLLRAYHWPGNIRELQNVVERAVILSDAGTFSLEENWLTGPPARKVAPIGISSEGMLRLSEDRQRELIEAALSTSEGRVSGTHGAARKLGIPRQTLESKIASLGIDKHRYKSRRS